METVIIREFDHESDFYQEELALRDMVLRKPLGMCLYDENLTQDRYDTHLGAFHNERLLGVMLLTKLSDEEYKMRQVAVDEAFQKAGIGSALVSYAESLIRERGGKRILLHTRKNALGFYQKLGYQTYGEEFIEVTLPHREMFKEL